MAKKVLTICPYCGSGCQIYLFVENGEIIKAEPGPGRTNENELCLKGYYGWDFLKNPKRLTARLERPLLRYNRTDEFKEVSWEEAIGFAAKKLADIKAKYGPNAIMCTGSARGSGNEANYIMQKFVRAAIGTNNIDHCARVCHGSSVAGLAATLGSGAMSNSIPEIENTKCVLIFGYNPAESHPIVARRIIKAREKGAKVIVVDPRFTEQAKISDLWLALKNGTNMALVNALGNVLITEKLYNKKYVTNYTDGFEEYCKAIEKYTPEYVENITGIEAKTIRQAARIYAEAESATILWGMGVTQFTQAVDVVKGLSSLALLTGNLGRENVGVGPVRGQNNVQGACDHGALPALFPGYQSVEDETIRRKFELAWGVKLPAKPGYHLTEIPRLAKEGKVKAYYIFGEDLVQSDPDAAGVREALASMELVIVQDIFMNKTALHADVIFPATSWGEHEGVYSSADRRFQKFNKAIEPKGDVKPDWEIISLLSTALGYPMKYNNTEEIWEELRKLCPLYAGVTYKRLEEFGSILWPCPDENHPGTKYLYEGNKFATSSGKGLLFAAEYRPPQERPDEEYPLILCTVREIGHYSVRTMTGNCSALQTLSDEPGYIQINPKDAEKLDLADQELAWITSRRGKVIARILITERVNIGTVYMTYHWWIGACNELTIDALDPISKTPEFKYCAVKLELIADQVFAEDYVQQEYSNLKKKMFC
ncbi:MAG: formate dehydrogenase, alpha subunit [Firmicutes bacterium]|nr:formate dehydrogenase, alpha subunit [Bacillota bacterium]